VLKNEKYERYARLKTKQFSVVTMPNLPSVVLISGAENKKAGKIN